jgi:peptidoglycan/LPS O-acetylase OafA/YrhL
VYLGLAAAVYATVRARAKLAPLQALGRQSYAIYLSHFWILAVVAERLPCHRGLSCLAVAMILTTSLSYGVALLIHRLIEAPINRFTKQLTGPNPS